jgi:hypothetical protein
MTWSRWSIAVLLAVAAAVPVAAGSHPLVVKVGPQVSFEPGMVRVTAYLEPDSNNRRLVIAADSGEHFTSSEVPLDGDRQPRATSIWLTNLPAGEYELSVRVEQGRGKGMTEHRTFEVVSARVHD